MISLTVFVASLLLSLYIFVVVQVLQSYPFYHLGSFGPQQLILLSYSQTLELASPICVLSFAILEFERCPLVSRRSRVVFATGRTLLFVGAIITVLVYTEIHLVWGELWYGLHITAGLPGGGGYPWGDEQVAYNLCFIKEPSYGPQNPNCYMLNYNGLLAFGVGALIIGGIREIYHRSNVPAEE